MDILKYLSCFTFLIFAFIAERKVVGHFARGETTRSKIWFFISYVFCFFGILMHELMHFVVGVLLKAGNPKLDLIPSYKDFSYARVFANLQNPLKAIPVALAPLLLAIPAFLLLGEHSVKSSQIVEGFIAAQLLHAAWPSKVDWNIAKKASLTLILGLGLLAVILFWVLKSY